MLIMIIIQLFVFTCQLSVSLWWLCLWRPSYEWKSLIKFRRVRERKREREREKQTEIINSNKKLEVKVKLKVNNNNNDDDWDDDDNNLSELLFYLCQLWRSFCVHFYSLKLIIIIIFSRAEPSQR